MLSPRRIQNGVAGGVAALLACAGCGFGARFSYVLPADIPNLKGWEKSEARARVENPSRLVEYQLFVRPGREATYEVIRYRVTYADPREAARLGDTVNERLQWDLNGRTLRRFELMPTAQGPRWEELTAGSARYTRETFVIIALMGLHRELLQVNGPRR